MRITLFPAGPLHPLESLPSHLVLFFQVIIAIVIITQFDYSNGQVQGPINGTSSAIGNNNAGGNGTNNGILQLKIGLMFANQTTRYGYE
jgi:hypothetical protein